MADIVEQYRLIATQFLETRPSREADDGARRVAVALLHSVGVTDDDLIHVDLEDPDHEALQVLVQERLQARLNGFTAQEAPAPAPEQAQVAPKGPQQALVRIEDVGRHLESGWLWRTEAPAPAGQALVEAPAGTPKPLGPATTATETAA